MLKTRLIGSSTYFSIIGCVLTLLAHTYSFSQEEKKVLTKPNILLLLVDDLKPTLGTYGDPIAKSPNLDKLAASGMRFNWAYANQAVCAPSRYNLMLGSRSTSTGIYGFGQEFREVYPKAITLPQVFQKAGYHTESMGKVYHIGHGNTGDARSWSIPHFKEKVIEYIVPESTGRKLTREEAFFENTRMYIKDTPKNNELPRGAAWESPDVLDDAYADARVANHAIDRLRKLSEKQEKPFFMAVGFARPHLPFSVPKKYWNLYDPQKLPLPKFEGYPKGAPKFAVKRGGEIDQFTPIPQGADIYEDSLKRKLIHGYYASISYMDAQLGRVMDELNRLNLDKNTIVVLWGDHGWHLGDHGIWTKHTNYEQATRIPLIFVAPGVTKPGSSTDRIAETVDIYPTLADLAGLQVPDTPQPMDGSSLKSTLNGSSKGDMDYAYHSYIRNNYLGEAIRDNRYRMVRWTNLEDKTDVIFELYDYQKDPQETENIAKDNPEKVSDLLDILNAHPEARHG
ncbi:MAG TPA: sulfatase [Pricia sp.]|nr:sulfatase [Pricia sp.]